MVNELNAGNADDDDISTVSVADNVDQLLANDVADSIDQLIKAKRDDLNLASCWEMAKVNKSNYVVDHGILFHYDQVEGQKVCNCVCLSVNVMPYFTWPMILYLVVILPSGRLVNAFVCHFIGLRYDRVSSSM